MASLHSRVWDSIGDERGASAVEYGLLVALIAVIIIGAVTLLGGNLRDIFDAVADAISDMTP